MCFYLDEQGKHTTHGKYTYGMQKHSSENMGNETAKNDITSLSLSEKMNQHHD